jgi:hypothetical protein
MRSTGSRAVSQAGAVDQDERHPAKRYGRLDQVASRAG